MFLIGTSNDLRAVPGRQRRNESVHFPVEMDVLDRIPAINLKSCSEIVNVHARELRHHPVGDPRRKPPEQKIVDAPLSPSAHNFAVLRLECLEHYRNVSGIVLQVTVH